MKRLAIVLFACLITPCMILGAEDDPELQAALAASLAESQKPKPPSGDTALQEAIKASIIEESKKQAERDRKVREARELKAINEQIAQAQAAVEAERKRQRPQATPLTIRGIIEDTAARALCIPINVIRPAVMQQTGTECGYLAAIYGGLVYQGFIKNKLPRVLELLKDRAEMQKLQKIWQDKLGCATLDEGHILTIMTHYKMNPVTDFTIASRLLTLDQLIERPREPRTMPTLLRKLHTQRGFTHLFFLRIPGGHKGAKEVGLGHWIAVVAHNNNNQKIDLYVLDSLYPAVDPKKSERDNESALRNRASHDQAWQALEALLNSITIS